MKRDLTHARGAAGAATRARDLRWFILYISGLALLLALVWSAGAHARAAPESFADLAEELLPSVVNIQVTQTVTAGRDQGRPPVIPQLPPGSPFEEFFKDFFDRQQREGGRRSRPVSAVGSGFIIDAEGLVVTNNHVVDDAEEINVIFHDGNKAEAEVVGTDPKTDLAVLRFKPAEGASLKAIRWGDSDLSRVGDWVVAIGNPLGLGGTVTAGIISARGRDIRAGPYDDFIQTDASINKGNSGGPLFNMDGEVIGINTAIYSQSGGSIGIGFSVPSNLARNVVAQLVEFGRTKRGWLGVQIQTVTEEIADGLGLDEAHGALVAKVNEEGPANKAGVEMGDVILKFDGKQIKEMRQLPRIVAETRVGADVDVQVWRKGEIKNLSVRLGELEKAETKVAALRQKGSEETGETELSALGMKLSALTPEMRERFKLGDDVKGVVVVDVDEESAAAEKGIRPGDVIVEVGQEEVENPSQVAAKVTEEQESKKRKTVLLLVQRAGDLMFVAVRLKGDS